MITIIQFSFLQTAESSADGTMRVEQCHLSRGFFFDFSIFSILHFEGKRYFEGYGEKVPGTFPIHEKNSDDVFSLLGAPIFLSFCEIADNAFTP